MFVSSNQIYVFISCVAFGACFGVFRSILLLIKEKVKNKIINGVLEILFFILLSFGFTAYSYLLEMPNFRAYMIVGVLVGIYAYVKSFHYILAKIIKRVYNMIIKSLNKKIRGKKPNGTSQI